MYYLQCCSFPSRIHFFSLNKQCIFCQTRFGLFLKFHFWSNYYVLLHFSRRNKSIPFSIKNASVSKKSQVGQSSTTFLLRLARPGIPTSPFPILGLYNPFLNNIKFTDPRILRLQNCGRARRDVL